MVAAVAPCGRSGVAAILDATNHRRGRSERRKRYIYGELENFESSASPRYTPSHGCLVLRNHCARTNSACLPLRADPGGAVPLCLLEDMIVDVTASDVRKATLAWRPLRC